ncbi:MAG TPA: hypothetical protein VNE63_13600 [Candidatus Acidoferrales bacterium]|nr:hypothetical protein [Candidatus Acidoferrales bacterium]
MNNEDEEVMQIGCVEFEEILQDLDRPGTRGSALRENALAHAEFCDRCARLMTQAESLDFALHAIAARGTDAGAPQRVEAAVMQEFRRQKAESSGPGIRRRLAAIGAAAAVLLVLGFSLRHSQARHLNAGVTKETPVQNVAGAEPGDQAAENQASNLEYATPFVPLPYADDPATLEGGTVVLVVLSRAALASLGVPVVDVSAGEQIPADIVLSEDGAPQAVRLVSEASLNQ